MFNLKAIGEKLYSLKYLQGKNQIKLQQAVLFAALFRFFIVISI
jgi:hypothetical protein